MPKYCNFLSARGTKFRNRATIVFFFRSTIKRLAKERFLNGIAGLQLVNILIMIFFLILAFHGLSHFLENEWEYEYNAAVFKFKIQKRSPRA